jgi:hypothetical protein
VDIGDFGVESMKSMPVRGVIALTAIKVILVPASGRLNVSLKAAELASNQGRRLRIAIPVAIPGSNGGDNAMSFNEKNSKEGSLLVGVLDWWHGARQRWARLHELDQFSPAEIEHLAADVGLDSADFLHIARQPNGDALLIEKRLAALHLDSDQIRKLSPLLLRDLQRTCAMCSEKRRCADDIAETPSATGWESYCPNSSTLRTLA